MTPRRNRRDLLALAGISVAALAAWRLGLYRRLLAPPDFPFTDLAGLDGFRLLKSGSVSLGAVAFLGLDTEKPAALRAAEQRVNDNLCAALFEQTVAAGDRVPVAYFYDYQCPICRRLTPRLRELTGVALTWHDLASLGPASETAARAAIAARKQGAFDVFHDRLMRAVFQPNQGYIRALADSVGVDADRLLSDMGSPEITRRLWLSRALANRFAMLGTPGLVIGRSVVIGDISSADLVRIIDLERAEAAQRPC